MKKQIKDIKAGGFFTCQSVPYGCAASTTKVAERTRAASLWTLTTSIFLRARRKYL